MNVIKTFLPRSLNSNFGALDCVAFPGGDGFLYITLCGVGSIHWASNSEKEPLVKVFTTNQSIFALDIDPGWSRKDNSVLLWDFNKHIPISGHKVHCSSLRNKESNDKSQYTVVHISFLKNRNLLSLSAKKLVLYCVESNSTWVRPNFIHFKGHITTLKCSPVDEHIFDCGSSKGDIWVCDLQKLNVVYTLGSHQKPVVSLSWNAVELNTEEKNPQSYLRTLVPRNLDLDNDNMGQEINANKKDGCDCFDASTLVDFHRNKNPFCKYYNGEIPQDKKISDIILASVSFDGQVFLWNTLTGSYCDRFKITEDGCSNNCRVMWVNSEELFVLIANGDLIQLKLVVSEKRLTPLNMLRQYKFETSMNIIVKNIFTFTQQRDSNGLLWYIKANLNCSLACMNLRTRQEILSHSTVINHVFAICESPSNISKIGFAFANSTLALLDIQNLSQIKTNFQYMQHMPTLRSGIKVLAWHGNGEYLCYGTLNGTLGVINVCSQVHLQLNSVSSGMVCAMTWRGNQIFLIQNNQLRIYAIEFQDPLAVRGFKGSYSTIAVYQSLVLLGSNHGYLEIYREKTTENTTAKCLSFDLIQLLEVAKHYITDISFNPIDTEQFAMVAGEAYVYLLNVNPSNGTAKITQKLDCGSSKAQIYKVKWSNRYAHKLITCGLDGGLRLFDLSRPENEQLTYVKQFICPLYTAMFLPTDERFVLCTGKLLTIEIVDTEEPLMENNSYKSYLSLNGIKWASQTHKNQTANLTALRTEITKPELSGVFSEMKLMEDPENELKILKVVPKFLKSPETVLAVLTSEENKNPLLTIQEYLASTTETEKKANLKLIYLFSEKVHAEKFLSDELVNLKSQNSSATEINAIFLNQISGGLEAHIQNAIQDCKLNECHLSLASSVSFSFWQKCCEAFAKQLAEQKCPLQAALYLLTLNKHLDAIKVLIAANCFKDAMLVGRIYLCEQDPLLHQITDKWIYYLENQGDLPTAVLICTIIKQYRRAYKILSKEPIKTLDGHKALMLLKNMT